jgi:DNA replication protein DnaC
VVIGRLTGPTVSPARIKRVKQANKVPHLFLEELDKFNMTDFRRAAIFDVINAMHECKGQIVLNSNLSWDEFEQTFGTAFSWRIAENCYVVDLFKGSVTPPKMRL